MDAQHLKPAHIRYIKLGTGGAWARRSFEEGHLSFGYHSIAHDVCERKDWVEVRKLLSGRNSDGAVTAGVTEVSTFYEMGEDCLWITFAEGHLWWTYAGTHVIWVGDGSDGGPSRYRPTIGAWSKTNIHGEPLRITSLSSNLTKVANFRATICTVTAEDYLLRRINGVEEPLVTRARGLHHQMVTVTVDMIRALHWADFETLTDLIFARSGWRRTSRLGGTSADVDLVIEQPTINETAFVQVKSRANQAVVNDYLQRFRASGHNRFFFVCHSAQGHLEVPAEPQLHLLEGARLAEAAIANGLFDWLVERSG